MSIVATCVCVTFEKGATLRFCAEHHRYFRGAKQLTSLTSVIKSTWPIAPDFSKADPGVLENARERGVQVDQLFSAYVVGGLQRIPAGTRQDAVALFMKAKKWWDARPRTIGTEASQVILADSEIAGTCDVIVDNCILDVKCSYNLEAFYPLQVAGYADLYEDTFSIKCEGIGILHLAERFQEARWIPLNMAEHRQDWRTLRTMWKMVQQRIA